MKQAVGRISAVVLVMLGFVSSPVLTGCDGSEMRESVDETVRELSGAELLNKGEKLKQQIRDLNAQDVEKIQEDISRGVYGQE